MGYDVRNVVEFPSSVLQPNSGYNRLIRSGKGPGHWMDIFNELRKGILNYDVFIFNFSSSFFRNFPMSTKIHKFHYLDLSLMKFFKKKIVFFVNGSDLRSLNLLIKDMESHGLRDHVKYLKIEMRDQIEDVISEKRKEKDARTIMKKADHIFCRPNSAQFLKDDYHIYWVPTNLKNFRYKESINNIPTVVHAPSRRAVKGTKYVINAVDKLKSQGCKFNFKLIENVPNDTVRKILTDSEIVIDQVILPGYGLFCIEAMASGNVLLGSGQSGYNAIPDDFPMITSTPNNLAENLKNAIENASQRKNLFRKGRKYVEKYHDHRKLAKYYSNIILND